MEQMANINENVFKPALRRLGALAAGGLIGVLSISDPELVQAIKVICVAVAAMAWDLGYSYVERK